jgi:hypothetical protein
MRELALALLRIALTEQTACSKRQLGSLFAYLDNVRFHARSIGKEELSPISLLPRADAAIANRSL